MELGATTGHDGLVPGTDLIVRATTVAADLHREPEQATVAGLCAAISRRTGIDLSFLRICVVFGSLFFGVGAVMYCTGWVLTPRSDRDRVPLAKVVPAAASWDARRRVLITAGSGAVTFIIFASSSPFSIVAVAAAIACYLYLRNKAASSARDRQPNRARDAVRTSQFPAAGAESWTPPYRSTSSSEPAAASSVAQPHAPVVLARPDPWMPNPRRHGLRSALGLLGLVLAAATASVAYWGARHLVPTTQLLVACSAALASLGLMLIVSALMGLRPRFLMMAGVIVALWIAGLQIGIVNSHGSWGSVVTGNGSPTTPRTFVGTDATLNVTQADNNQTIHLSARASHLVVLVPRSMDAEVHFNMRMSSVVLGGNDWNGADQDSRTLLAESMPEVGNAPRVVLVIDAVMSNVEVRHG